MWQFSKIAIFAYVNLLRVIDHKIKNPSIRTKHNLLSSNQSKVTTVGYGGGRVSAPLLSPVLLSISLPSYNIPSHQVTFLQICCLATTLNVVDR